MAELTAELNRARRSLLDLGLRNSLLNHRLKAKQVRIVDELAAQIFQMLVAGEKKMYFDAVPDEKIESLAQNLQEGQSLPDAITENLMAQPDESEDTGIAQRHTDNRLQTNLSSKMLQTRLLSIHSTARTMIEEQGVNTLYLALGFMHWYEADSAQEARRAPLILIPASLSRSSARDRFHVSYSGEDMGDNLSLAEKLKAEFAITLPSVDDDEGLDSLDVESYFKRVEKAVSGYPRWKIEKNEIALGFFSFGKFLMYQDLDAAQWPSGGIEQNELLDALLVNGFSNAEPSIDSEDRVDDLADPKALRQVVDSDSSQTIAILHAQDGKNMVLQGPPGTGKSQTITNLIAAAISRGQKVLFVAEKMAALEVVKHRLDNIALGDSVLEIHSHKTNKKSLIAELERTLHLEKPVAPSSDGAFDTLSRLVEDLNAYCDVVNAPVANSKTSFVSALGHAIRTAELEASAFDFEPMAQWSEGDYRQAKNTVEAVDRFLSDNGRPQSNPFYGTELKAYFPAQADEYRETIKSALIAAEELCGILPGLVESLGLNNPATLGGVKALVNVLARLSEAPGHSGVQVKAQDWRERVSDIHELLEAGKSVTETKKKFEDLLIDQAWDASLLPIRQTYASKGDKWWRFFSSDFRSARNQLQGFARGELPKDASAILQILDEVLESQGKSKQIAAGQELGKRLFGNRWRDEQSDWRVLERLTDWLQGVHDAINAGALPAEFLECLQQGSSGEPVKSKANQLNTATTSLYSALSALTTSIQMKEDWVTDDMPVSDLIRTLKTWTSDFSLLEKAVRFNQICEELGEVGLSFLADQADEWDFAPGSFAKHFQYSWYKGLVEYAYANEQIIQRFDRSNHEQSIEKFRNLDQLIFERNRTDLVLQHWEGIPTLNQTGELGIIRREINKKRRHLPIRKLISQAGRAIQAIKPVFMMGPMSIATYIPPGALTFDLVIFDEASQVKPVDAFGALLRSKQAIVVGDSKQLPPTSFFDSMTDIGDDDDFDQVGDTESILGLFLAKGAHEHMLRWHYRSKHDSLIAISNQEFYDNKLKVFPTPGRTPNARGLHFHHHPETFYERGTSRSNIGEAKIIALAVFKHAAETPDLTLGVVAFSVAQRDAIEMELEVLRRAQPEYEEFFQGGTLEPFFVKNLENVQGDERDVILISIGYGKTEEGYMAMSFGPLNRDGGERRLNVMITRARRAMDVFANFSSADLDTSRTNARGVIALKSFLAFAETGQIQQPYNTGKAPDSPFEESVLDALRSRGYICEPQVGTSGFFIDIAVADPDRPGAYILGIECDGAAYHSSRSARDRDRLRQSVLENLGWRFHRIWSTDWYRHPEQELERAIDAIEKAKLFANRPLKELTKPPAKKKTFEIDRQGGSAQEGESLASSKVVPYKKATIRINTGNYQLGDVDPTTLVDQVQLIVDTESPVHQKDVLRRITEGAGLSRAGAKIQSVVSNAIDLAHKQRSIKKAKGFLWSLEMEVPSVRDRSQLSSSDKKTDRIAPEEISSALILQIESNFTMTGDEAIFETGRCLGFQRVTAQFRETIETQLKRLVRSGMIVKDGDSYTTGQVR